MAKPKSKPKPPPLHQLYRLATAATETGVARSTIMTAADAGHIESYRTACGLTLVTLPDVLAYKNNPPATGYHAHKANQPKIKAKPKPKAKS